MFYDRPTNNKPIINQLFILPTNDRPGTPSRPMSATVPPPNATTRPGSPGTGADGTLALTGSRPGTAGETDKIPSPTYYDDSKTKFAHRWVIPPFGSVQFKGTRAKIINTRARAIVQGLT